MGPMMKYAALLAALMVCGPAAGQDSASVQAMGEDSTWQEHARAGEAARAARDWGGWRYHLVRVREEVGYHPSLVFNLARADAALGRTEDALEWLRTFAASGLTRDVANDSTLASIRQTPGWAALAERIAANARPVSNARLAFTLPDSAFMPEGIAFDPRTRRFFLSSLRSGRILSHGEGGFAEFVPAGRDGQWAVLGIAVDTLTHTLWATTYAAPYFSGYAAADSGKSAVLAYDLDTGALRRRYAPPEGAAHQLGDIAVAPDGDVFVSDADEGAVYRIERGSEEMEAFAQDELVSPQGLAFTSDGRRVLVADYVRGIASLERETGELEWITAADSVAVSGIDGLVRVGHRLVAVQNGVAPKRVVELRMDEAERRITGWRALESATPLLTEPTHAVVVGGEVFFIADSGWDRLDPDGQLKPGMVLEPAHVLRVAVP